MTLSTLALRNALMRNPLRSSLTVAGTMMAALAFVFLRTILAAWYSSSEASSADRVVTRNAISITQSLPLSYVERVKQIPGVTAATWQNWFGGVYIDQKHFFARWAVDPTSAIEVFGLRVTEGSKDEFIADRNSCLMGSKIARQYGFKLGDTVPLQGDIYPGDWRFKIAGMVEADDASVAQSMFFHWARVNDDLPERRKDQVGVITSRIADAANSPKVVKAIDDTFANSDNETHTETEKAFRLSFVSGSSAILGALQAVSFVILIIMALILGNTLAMGLRERTAEMGAMRAIGFLPKHIVTLTLFEGAVLGLLGGLLAMVVANPMLNAMGAVLEGFGFLSGVRFSAMTGALTLGSTLGIGLAASAVPAWSGSKMEVVAALRRQE